jgi:large subunit ribosomal protein L24
MALRKIKKDDEVIVLTGRDKGKRGKVVRVITGDNRVIVQGVNMVKRHQRADQTNPQGGIVEKEATIHVSNVAHVDPKTGDATRVGVKVLEDGRKVRFSKRSGEVIDV